MIFQHTHDWVFTTSPHTNQPKRQTRRRAKLSECLRTGQHGQDVIWRVDPDGNWKPLYWVGQVLAVQPGRGQAAIGRIRIRAVREAYPGGIDAAGLLAEGFATKDQFLDLYRQMHEGTKALDPCWVLTFEVVP
jgi:hypothetical protein